MRRFPTMRGRQSSSLLEAPAVTLGLMDTPVARQALAIEAGAQREVHRGKKQRSEKVCFAFEKFSQN